jgi:hypothetical protein
MRLACRFLREMYLARQFLEKKLAAQRRAVCTASNDRTRPEVSVTRAVAPGGRNGLPVV